jgi:hypothetical protein
MWLYRYIDCLFAHINFHFSTCFWLFSQFFRSLAIKKAINTMRFSINRSFSPFAIVLLKEIQTMPMKKKPAFPLVVLLISHTLEFPYNLRAHRDKKQQ